MKSVFKLWLLVLFAILTVTSCSSGNEPADPKPGKYPVFKYEDITLTVTDIYYGGKGDEKVTVHYDLIKKSAGILPYDIRLVYSITAKDGTVFREETGWIGKETFKVNNFVSNWDLINVSVAKEIDTSTLKIEFVPEVN